MLTTTPPDVTTLYYAQDRETLLARLRQKNPGWDFLIGTRRLGAPHFRSEYPEMEIVGEYRPVLLDRVNRFAVYARRAG